MNDNEEYGVDYIKGFKEGVLFAQNGIAHYFLKDLDDLRFKIKKEFNIRENVPINCVELERRSFMKEE
jgi:hypothetical protein